AVKSIQNHGMLSLGGFVVGFDNDPPSIFESQIHFIQEMGVVTAMVGILTALPKTRLYNRLKDEGRLLKTSSGNNTDGSLNFVPKMGTEALVNGYRKIMQTIYSPEKYYERIITFLKEYKPVKRRQRISLALAITSLKSFLKSVWYLGIVEESRRYYWKLVTKALFKYPRAFPVAVSMAIHGFHFRKVAQKLLK
ncbi:MAG TPA: B12-binding domain-containing radical SAM protein, partial [Dehalococcoidia bacterium]|nr:B12-binding domain-containing radical SAM protein [Dehalococcoidia bacterium]